LDEPKFELLSHLATAKVTSLELPTTTVIE
jgi:hypothetical protein